MLLKQLKFIYSEKTTKFEEIDLLVLTSLLNDNVKLKTDFFKSLWPFKKNSTLHFQAGLYKKEDSCTSQETVLEMKVMRPYILPGP